MDFQLIANGNRTAFEELFREHYRPLCAFGNTYLKDPERAEDIVQDLFVKLWNERERLVVNTSLKAYLFAAVRNRCLNEKDKVVRMRPLNDPTKGSLWWAFRVVATGGCAQASSWCIHHSATFPWPCVPLP